MAFKWRKWNRNLHRDIGYFFVGMSIIYGISGIAINHWGDWNPNFKESEEFIQFNQEVPVTVSKSELQKIVNGFNNDYKYKNHIKQGNDQLKVYIVDGTITVNCADGSAFVQLKKKRKVLHELNYLHYNPKKWWTLFADIFSGALVFLAISGLFILKGKNGIKGRGAYFSIAGILIPIIYLLIYYYNI